MGVQRRNGRFEVYVYRADVGRKAYVGTREVESEAQALFREKTEEFAGVSSAGRMASGIAAEHFAIAELLSRGHRVAKPVVDEDGVDLVVDYRIKVQVKSSSTIASMQPGRKHAGYLTFHCARRQKGKPNRPYDVDVFLFFDRPRSMFYVVPVGATPKGGVFQLCPKYEEYRDAWGWFREQAA